MTGHSYPRTPAATAWSDADITTPLLAADVRAVRGGAAIVSVRGELDIGSAEIFDEIIGDAIARYGPRLTVDAAGISFCDVRGLDALVAAAAAARRAGGALVLINTPRLLNRLLGIAGLDQHLRSRRHRDRPRPRRCG